MIEPGDLDSPWLVAAWPGMGHVALGAAQHMLSVLDAEVVVELTPGGHFDITQVPVKGALLQPARFPDNTLYGRKATAPGGRDLLLFVSEAQPAFRGYEFCSTLLDVVETYDVSKAFTFAAMATPNHPQGSARVFAAVTHPRLLTELQEYGVEEMPDGDISGLNGVFLAAAAERGIEGVCLLGEFPYFATAIPNPKASAAVLDVFGRMTGLDFALTPLEEEGAEMAKKLAALLERLQKTGQLPLHPEIAGVDEGLTSPGDEAEPGLAAQDRRRIEELFHRAEQDRAEALELKAELDRLGVFKEFEDRFLDLFKQGG